MIVQLARFSNSLSILRIFLLIFEQILKQFSSFHAMSRNEKKQKYEFNKCQILSNSNHIFKLFWHWVWVKSIQFFITYLIFVTHWIFFIEFVIDLYYFQELVVTQLICGHDFITNLICVIILSLNWLLCWFCHDLLHAWIVTGLCHWINLYHYQSLYWLLPWFFRWPDICGSCVCNSTDSYIIILSLYWF